MTDNATMQARLNELEAARHKLLTGTQTVSVSYGDTKVEYRAALFSDMQAIDMEIARLKMQLGLTSRRAIGVRFG